MSNVVPEGWAIKTVGELSSVKRGASPRPIKDARWWGGNVGWVRISDVTSSNKYLKKTTQYLSAEGVSKSVKINKGEVVLSICATIGRPIIVSVDACIHDGFVWFDKLSQSIDREFWYYFLTNKEEYFSSQRQSGTQGNLNTAIVSDLNCLLPPLPEQKKIAAILTSVDEVIEKTQAQIDKLKDLKTAMMQELLTCGVGVDGKPHTEFKDSPVGRIPKGWEVKSLDTVVKCVVDCEHKTAPYVEQSEFMVVRTSNVRDGELVFDDMKFTHSDGFNEWTKRTIPTKGDVLFTREAPAGESCLVPDNLKVCMGQRMVLLRPDNDVVESDFFSMFLTSEAAKKSIFEMSIGTTVSRINIEDIKKIPCVVPPKIEQIKIANTISCVQKLLSTKQGKLESLNLTKKALMQDLLTGKVRVKVD
ncbi:restriction endonuclease subunit S [Vibrio rumoiensis]|uniref:restriction endonuclease subunit S n=1 Tax=Vibrio rumoiensis TaxID=76258 RepID=UPI000B5CE267|nr:restriction endonuclease subunit S [Vibrio rumoiensis]